MPIKDPKIKDRPDTDPLQDPQKGPDMPVKEPPKKQKPKIKEPEKPRPRKK